MKYINQGLQIDCRIDYEGYELNSIYAKMFAGVGVDIDYTTTVSKKLIFLHTDIDDPSDIYSDTLATTSAHYTLKNEELHKFGFIIYDYLGNTENDINNNSDLEVEAPIVSLTPAQQSAMTYESYDVNPSSGIGILTLNLT